MNPTEEVVLERIIEEHLEDALDIPTEWVEDQVTTSRFWLDEVEPLLREHVAEIVRAVVRKKIDMMVRGLVPKIKREMARE